MRRSIAAPVLLVVSACASPTDSSLGVSADLDGNSESVGLCVEHLDDEEAHDPFEDAVDLPLPPFAGDDQTAVIDELTPEEVVKPSVWFEPSHGAELVLHDDEEVVLRVGLEGPRERLTDELIETVRGNLFLSRWESGASVEFTSSTVDVSEEPDSERRRAYIELYPPREDVLSGEALWFGMADLGDVRLSNLVPHVASWGLSGARIQAISAGNGSFRSSLPCPSLCPDTTRVPLHYDSSEEPMSEGWGYGYNLDTMRYISASARVKEINLTFRQFAVDPGDDFVLVGDSTPVGGGWVPPPPAFLTGNLPGVSVTVRPMGSLQANPAYVALHSGGDRQHNKGFRIEEVDICCQPEPPPSRNQPPLALRPTNMRLNQHYMGLLLGVGDRVEFAIPAQKSEWWLDEPGPFTEGRIGRGWWNMTFQMWGDAANRPGNFDLHVECNSPAVPGRARGQGVSHDSQEFVQMRGSDCPDGTWHATVTSLEGTGTFHLVASANVDAKHVRTLRVGTAFDASPEQLELIRSDLQRGARHFFGATEGTYLIEQFDIYNSGRCSNYTSDCDGQQCTVCVHSQAAGEAVFPTQCQIGPLLRGMPRVLHYFIDDPDRTQALYIEKLFSHEWGHCLVPTTMPEEYDTHGAYCGHSLMGAILDRRAPVVTNDYCTPRTHGLNPAPGAGPSRGSPVWGTYLIGPGATFPRFQPWVPPRTPENSSYMNFDFNGQIGVGVLH